MSSFNDLHDDRVFFKFFAAWGCLSFALAFLFYGGLVLLIFLLLAHYGVIG